MDKVRVDHPLQVLWKGWEIPDLQPDTLGLNWTRGSHTISEVRGGKGSNYEHGEGE